MRERVASEYNTLRRMNQGRIYFSITMLVVVRIVIPGKQSPNMIAIRVVRRTCMQPCGTARWVLAGYHDTMCLSLGHGQLKLLVIRKCYDTAFDYRTVS